MSEQLEFYVAQRAGQSAVVRRADGVLVGWVVRGQDGLLRVRMRGARAPLEVEGAATVPAALAAMQAARRSMARPLA